MTNTREEVAMREALNCLDNYIRNTDPPQDIYEAFDTLQAAQADARALVGELVGILQGAMDEADGCELNMSNYHHDDVHNLNNSYVVLFQTAEQALTKAQAFMEDVCKS